MISDCVIDTQNLDKSGFFLITQTGNRNMFFHVIKHGNSTFVCAQTRRVKKKVLMSADLEEKYTSFVAVVQTAFLGRGDVVFELLLSLRKIQLYEQRYYCSQRSEAVLSRLVRKLLKPLC